MKDYLPRIADELLKQSLLTSGAVLIEGPKWCGKTSTASRHSNSTIFIQDPDNRSNYMQTASIKPSLLLEGDPPLLIDEWQLIPVLWDSVRFEVDRRNTVGQFIMTGSSVPVLDEEITHSGTGRISRLLMRPMSLYESLESNGQIRLSDLFHEQIDLAATSKITVEEMAHIIIRGGWPAAVTTDSGPVENRARDYIESIINIDISRVDGITKNPDKVRALLRSIARNTATEASNEVLRRDVEGGDDETITPPTIASYINALQRLFVLDDLRAWNPSLRSRTPLRTSPKRHFIDPSLAAAALGIDDKRLLQDFNTFGYLFESLCVRDLKIYAEALDGFVYHYRDKSNLECDAVIVLRDGRWGAIEIKMGAAHFDSAAEKLHEFVEKIDTKKMSKPSFLMILTQTPYAYTRKDGVHVVPIGCLRH